MYQTAVLTVSQLTSTTRSQTVLLLTTLDLSSTSARSQMSLIHLVIVMAFYDLVIIFSSCGFLLLLSFFSSPNLSLRRLDVYHTSTHGVALVRI